MGVAALMVSGVTLVAPALLPSGPAGVASAQPAECADVQVVFARGTGEPAGIGRVGDAFVDALRPLVPGQSVDVYAVNYPASYDFLRAADGANDASAFVQNTVATCPDTRIVLGGFSQGAAVIDALAIANQPTLGFTNLLPPAAADHVAAVAVFGNPSIRLLGGPLTSLSPQYGYKTIDLCNGADPVCSGGDDRPAHSLYVQAGLTTQAAQFVASRLTSEAPITTLAGQTHG
ncbi:cutinase family protein [Mycolicibacterium gadium]|uniref:Cutinase family protein n=1 Tax=Mycolicibacterium gadium TaxID=1794 RepID=A0ABT6GVJ1_MYCGU|nr:cutinase family protein [Mycolicibacterium gadium]MDG5485248.1 cutinase family protein [Mycolicibacterium gadium]